MSDQTSDSPSCARTEWVRRHQAPLWRWLRFLGAPVDLAEDVLQDALTAALRAGVDRDRDDTTAASWLRSTGRHLFLSALRRQERRPAVELLPEALAEVAWRRHARSGSSDYVDALAACLQHLPPRQRRVVDLRYREDRSRAEIGAETGMAENGVKTLLRRLRADLRACVEAKLEEMDR